MYKTPLHATEFHSSPPEGHILFEVFNVASGKALSRPDSWKRTWREYAEHAHSGGVFNDGFDVRHIW